MSRLDDWAPHELGAFLAAVRGTRLQAAWHLAAAAGLRTGELLALRWADVDLDRARLDVRTAVVGVPYAAMKPPPTSSWSRTVKLDPLTHAILREHGSRQQAERSEWGSHYRDRGLVVCRENGEPLHPRSLCSAFARAVAESGLPPIGLSALRRSDVPRTVQYVGAA